MKMVLGERIKLLREKRDWTQTFLAKKIGISKSVMSRIEAGTRPLEDSLLVKLVDVLEVSSDYLIGVSENKITNDQAKNVVSNPKYARLPQEKKKLIDDMIDAILENRS